MSLNNSKMNNNLLMQMFFGAPQPKAKNTKLGKKKKGYLNILRKKV